MATKHLKQTYAIKAPVAAVWKALVNTSEINAWGGGPAKMNEKVGAKFSLWGGDIHGKNLKVEKGKLLVQEWLSKDWKVPSKVIFSLMGKGDKTQIKLEHTNIPAKEFSSIKKGWKDYYMGPMKDYLEEKYS